MLRALRHDHHRRGARAQPQHRLPARLPQAAAAPPARPQGDHHLGDHRPAAVRRALRRRAGRRGVRPDLPGRGPLPAARRIPDDDDERRAEVRDQTEAIVDAVDELVREGPGRHPGVPVRRAGDPRHRRRAAPTPGRQARALEVLPLYARLSAAEQHRVFAAARRTPGRAGHQRRRDLADRARHPVRRRPRHRPRSPATATGTKVQRLPIEPISQASANQRAGRCGRRRDGICIRLYSEEDFEARPEFTEPEILRTNLASVILQMTALGLGDIARVPVRRAAGPPRRSRDGVALLEELGALDPSRARPAQRLTPLGRQLARLPVDPRLAPDGPRGRPQRLRARGAGDRRRAVDPGPARAAAGPPAGRRPEARPVRRRPLGLPDLPATCGATCRSSSRSCPSSAFRRMCRAEFLNYLRVREWQDLVASCARSPSRSASAPPASCPEPGDDPSRVHTVAAAGPALAHRAVGPGQARVPRRARRPVRALPGVGAVQEAAALGDGRRAGRDLPAVGPRPSARIEPEWAEPLAAAPGQAHLQRAALVEQAAAAVMAYERVTLYGVPLVAGRKVAYGRIDPELSPRAVHPARAGRGRVAHPPRSSSHDNRELLEEVEELEHRARRRDILVDDETLFDFYDAAGRRPTSCPARTSTPGGRRPGATQPGPAHLRPGDADARRRRARSRARLPRHAGGRATSRCR